MNCVLFAKMNEVLSLKKTTTNITKKILENGPYWTIQEILSVRKSGNHRFSYFAHEQELFPFYLDQLKLADIKFDQKTGLFTLVGLYFQVYSLSLICRKMPNRGRKKKKVSPQKKSETKTAAKQKDGRTRRKGKDTKSPEEEIETKTPEKDEETKIDEKETETKLPEKGRRTPASESKTETPEKERETETPEKDAEAKTPEKEKETKTPEKDSESVRHIPRGTLKVWKVTKGKQTLEKTCANSTKNSLKLHNS